ncbi:MAG: hemolysin family protein [Dehalococcoidia bacterium]|nr:HlyC/CorC family transporter [Dehalococcoidia bacterium]MCA9826240.1 HlyC/CorC family transporter [Dehalococcoidia bacterium]MCA9845510.1 HlyC/CorC family transporter [Dehalococcoidia bacterium]
MTIALVLLLLLAVNALYVAAEFAAVSVRRSRIRQLAAEGNSLAMQLQPVLDSPRLLDRYIAACQVGITFSSLVLGAYGQATLPGHLAPAFESLGGLQTAAAQGASAIVVLLGLTALQVVVGELVPKSLALQYPTTVATWTVIPMRWSLRGLSPFISLLNGSALALLRLFRAPSATHGHVHSPDEIELLIVQSSDGGLLSREERRRLRKALQLGARTAREVMVPRTSITGVEASTPTDRLVQLVASSPYTRLPVYEGSIDNITGVLHARDLATAVVGGGAVDLRSLTRPVVTLPETITVDRLLTALREHESPLAIVVDEHGGVSGLVTVEDVLAEIFGDVADEFKGAGPLPVRLADGRIRLPGQMNADDAATWLGAEVEGPSDTIGGRVVDALGHIPAPGEQMEIDGVSFEVEAVHRHAVVSLLAWPVPRGERDQS